MKITESGYIKLHRSILSNTLWNEDRPRTKAEAWLELLMAAWYSDEPAKVMVGNKSLVYYRGEIYASLRYLADSWQWSKNKVDGFLALLQSEGMLTKRTDKGTGRTVITICKYDDYNPKNELKGQPKGRKRDSEGTGQGQRRDSEGTNNKKDKESKEVEEGKEGNEDACATEEEVFEKWMKDTFPRIQKLEQPLTHPQAQKLRERWEVARILEILRNMNNKKDLLTKYVCAYDTAINWLKRDDKSAKNGFTKSDRQERIDSVNSFEQLTDQILSGGS